MSGSFQLFLIQKIDNETRTIQARLDAIELSLANDPELEERRVAYQTAKQIFSDTLNAMNALEYQIDQKRIKINQSESALFSGRIQNPKELQDLQKEIESLKKQLSELEDQDLEVMAQLEETQIVLIEAESRLNLSMKRHEGMYNDLTAERALLQQRLSNLSSTRQAYTDQVSPQLLQAYDQLRLKKRGIAVAAIEDRACAVCGEVITQSLAQTVRSSQELSFCPNCGRILFIE